ncbi:peptidase [Arthrobacter sp. SW1]|uniref:PepSY-associated TM helix domain-containing protein n=1 Tax=Arthrobacter sp. SW1 TaxID=1920889 RepID=UPI000877B84E|nr:PepSY domain-containing protein [Arthrobacter sp. SW1]OFI36514.1 peptidase [Arthrobacter sp. SW1]
MQPSTRDAVPEQSVSSPPVNGGAWFRAFLLRLHFYAGILAAPFLLIAAVTGGLYALTPQLEKVLYARELHVDPVPEPLPLSAQVRSAVEHMEGAAPVSVRPAPGPEDTARVLFADPSLGESQFRTIFLDPGNAEIRGDLPSYGGSGSLPLRTWISNLHRSLNLGEPGRMYSELAASWLWLVALGGLLLWLDRRRRERTREGTRQDPVRRATSGRSRILRLHGTTGAVLLVAFLFLSSSGLSWSARAGENITALRGALGWTTPTVSTVLPGHDAADHGGHGEHSGHGGDASGNAAVRPESFDEVLRIARADVITARMIDIAVPTGPHKAWTVTEAGREWSATASVVAVDPAAGTVTSRADFDDFGPAAKLTRWAIAGHMGLLFGLPNQIFLFLVATGLCAMIVWGYVMWWKRRPTRGSAWAFGPAPRGGFLNGPRAGVLAVIALMVAVGIFLPLLGWSLLAFVALDCVLGLIKRRRPSPVR